MATDFKRGTDEPLLQSWESSWSPDKGGSFQSEFRGLNLTKMSALANQYANAGYAGSLRYEHNIATLTLSIPSSQIPGGGGNSPFSDITDKWEIAVDSEKPELFENSNFLYLAQYNDAATASATGVNYKSRQVIQAIKESANNPVLYKDGGSVDTTKKGVTPFQSFQSRMRFQKLKDQNGEDLDAVLGTGLNTFGSSPNISDFAYDYFEGRTNFVRSKYVVRHHTNAPSNYASNVADFNVERIYSMSRLVAECTSSTLWILPMPGYLVYKLNNYSAPSYLPANYYWGGLKMRSNAITAARGRVEINTDYIIDGWPQHTYGTALT